VLSVSGVRTASKSQKAAAAQKTFGHFTASLRQATSLHGEERFENLIASQQSLFDLRGQFETRHHYVS
jgi:hypothetical protein